MTFAHRRLAALFVLYASVALGAPSEQGRANPLRVGELNSTWAESPHPYAAGGSTLKVVAQSVVEHPGATYIKVEFGRFELAPDDEVVVRDPFSRQEHRYRGRGLRPEGGPFWSMSVVGDRAIVELRSGATGGAYGYDIVGYEHGFEPIYDPNWSGSAQRSICGSNDKRDVVCYQASHPTHFQQASKVARVVSCGGLCTGSLISCTGEFITNEHCDGGCGVTNLQAEFDYHNINCGGGGSNRNTFQAIAEVDQDVTLDYWLVTLGGSPEGTYGHLRVEPRSLIQDEVIYIPQHPGGRSKEFGIDSDLNTGTGGLCAIDAPNADGRGADTDTGYLCDTEGGSSGSPVISDASHNLLALHHFGGCTNQGIRMENIVPRIAQFLPSCSFCLPAATGVTATAGAPNEIVVDWNAVPGATGYRVYRNLGGCGAGAAVEVYTGPPPFVDTTASGGTTYGYIVEPLDGLCPGQQAACEEDVATGPCTLAPSFAGIDAAMSGLSDSCQIDLRWTAGGGNCSPGVVYNVYRSTTQGFTPTVAELLDSCLSGTSYADTTVAAGVRYFYKVLAEDSGGAGAGHCAGGATDIALVAERSVMATTNNPLSAFNDGAELTPQMTLGTDWTVSTASAASGTSSFMIPGTTTNTCSSLTTPSAIVTATSVLNFATRVVGVEANWDGGTVEVSNDQGASWVQVDPIGGYPVTFDNASSSCNNDRAGGGSYSGDILTWLQQTVDLSVYAGQDIRARFRFATDGSVPSTSWWIDDVEITDIADSPCTAGCGNGALESGEECDEGGETPTCDGDCTFVVCGDNLLNVSAGEECDDGNVIDGDGCSAMCAIETCLGANLAKIQRLLATELTPPVVEFSWDPDPNATIYHVNSVADKLELLDPTRNGNGIPVCDTSGPVSCNDPTSPTAPGVKFYQALSACDALTEGPF